MSVAQKEWPVRGRILMARISRTNGDPRKRKSLTDGVALVTGGSPGIGRAIPHRLGPLGASLTIFGPGRPAPHETPTGLAKNRVRRPTPIAHPTKTPTPIHSVS